MMMMNGDDVVAPDEHNVAPVGSEIRSSHLGLMPIICKAQGENARSISSYFGSL